MPRTTTAKAGKDRTREEAVAYAVANRIRVEILTALNERSATSAELARIVHQPLSTVTYHVHCWPPAPSKSPRRSASATWIRASIERWTWAFTPMQM